LQLINHSVPDNVVEGIKANIQQFFQFPAEVKKQFAQERGQLEGYGQLFVVSEHQKLDWADMLYLYTQPPEDRNLRFWPDQPANFRHDCDSSLPLVVSLLLNLITTSKFARATHVYPTLQLNIGLYFFPSMDTHFDATHQHDIYSCKRRLYIVYLHS
jgi:hypothetical protein